MKIPGPGDLDFYDHGGLYCSAGAKELNFDIEQQPIKDNDHANIVRLTQKNIRWEIDHIDILKSCGKNTDPAKERQL